MLLITALPIVTPIVYTLHKHAASRNCGAVQGERLCKGPLSFSFATFTMEMSRKSTIHVLWLGWLLLHACD